MRWKEHVLLKLEGVGGERLSDGAVIPLVGFHKMQKSQKILLVDDDQDLLDLYQQILSQLPSHPEVVTCSNGARAVAKLEEESFALLICDLRMPKMDGLQVLSIVRRKYPQLRTVVLTSLPDEEFRSRAYALGVDLFWQKPASEREIKLFIECLESLLGQSMQTGFRGVQHKSLVDIIQLECISQNSLVLRVTNGPLSGKIWVNNGEVVDAVAEDISGEAAFKGILSWKAGSFETLPAEPDHPRVIQKSYNGLLLETVQAIDESQWNVSNHTTATGDKNITIELPPKSAESLPLVMISRMEGAEFALVVDSTPEGPHDSRGLDNPKATADWVRQMMFRFGSLSDRLRAGQLSQIECGGSHRNAGITAHGGNILCMGWRRDLPLEDVREKTRKAMIQWAS